MAPVVGRFAPDAVHVIASSVLFDQGSTLGAFANVVFVQPGIIQSYFFLLSQSSSALSADLRRAKAVLDVSSAARLLADLELSIVMELIEQRHQSEVLEAQRSLSVDQSDELRTFDDVSAVRMRAGDADVLVDAQMLLSVLSSFEVGMSMLQVRQVSRLQMKVVSDAFPAVLMVAGGANDLVRLRLHEADSAFVLGQIGERHRDRGLGLLEDSLDLLLLRVDDQASVVVEAVSDLAESVETTILLGLVLLRKFLLLGFVEAFKAIFDRLESAVKVSDSRSKGSVGHDECEGQKMGVLMWV